MQAQLKIISYNVNGIRAAINKGFIDWLRQENPDIIHLQEVKALQEQVDVAEIENLGYAIYWHAAQKKGYSGVATFTKLQPQKVTYGIGHDFFDAEGRFLSIEINGIEYINSYFPSGTSGDIRQEKKEEYLDIIYNYCKEKIKHDKKIIVSGDFNICHKAIDISNPERHTHHSGFLPNEREWMDSFVELGFIDTFRLYTPEPHNYSWWSYRALSRQRNIGWRIDYHFITENLKHSMQDASILSDIVHSDHCPIKVIININNDL